MSKHDHVKNLKNVSNIGREVISDDFLLILCQMSSIVLYNGKLKELFHIAPCSSNVCATDCLSVSPCL